MHEPERPFVPPRCPRTSCRYHRSPVGWRWIHFGHYRRRADPQVVKRYRCCHCGRSFSTQTFRLDYWLRRPELLLPVAYALLACSGLRQITRALRCAHSTVMRLAARLGRHALLVLAAHRARGQLAEPLVIDGFESFAYSQFQPLHLNLVAGAASHYAYGFTFAPLRRKGTMTAAQRQGRTRLEQRHGRPDPKAIERTMAAALRLAVLEPQALTVRSDEHPAYPRAFRHLPGYSLQHEATPSTEARTAANPLFAVNRLDLLLRHNGANHKRETIAFSKRHQGVIERAALTLLWQNFTKPFSENHDGGTPAMRCGLAATPLSLELLLTERRFPSLVGLPAPWDTYYRREVDTFGIANPRRHALTYAF